jgi:NAD(P)H dehydrogenase (quinone)
MVTGASGHIGRKTLEHLLERKPANELIGLARDPAKAADLAALGVEIRQGDYMAPASLAQAFKGIDKLMLTSTHAFTDRNSAHANAIDEAVKAEVQHLVIMPIHRKEGSTFTMKEITQEDIFTEDKVRSSGLAWTVAYHPPFMDSLGFYIGPKAHETGIHIPPGEGKFAAVTRDDLAAAHAAILSGTGHEGRSYVLTGDPAVSFREVAGILSDILHAEVPFVPISDEEYLEILKAAAGVPDFVAEFVLKWVQGMNADEWGEQTKDLETLIGRKPKSAGEFFRAEYSRPPAV